MTEVEKLKLSLESARAALQFYADGLKDDGSVARVALQAIAVQPSIAPTRDEVLEEAARICDGTEGDPWPYCDLAEKAAAFIRALKSVGVDPKEGEAG